MTFRVTNKWYNSLVLQFCSCIQFETPKSDAVAFYDKRCYNCFGYGRPPVPWTEVK